MSLVDGPAWEKENPPALINCLLHKQFQVVSCPFCEQQKSFKLDAGKPRIGLVLREVPHAIEKLGTVLGFGAEKYSIGNWKNLEDIEGRFLDSMMRHLTAYHKGEKVDPESGESHLAHALFNLAILLEQEQRQ